jgi:transposase
MTLLILTQRERVALHDFLVHVPTAREHSRAQALGWLVTGATVAEAAARLGVSRLTTHNWVHHFEQRAGLELGDRLADAPRSGRPPTAWGIIDPWIEEVIDQDPRSFGYRPTVWTAPLLRRYLEDIHGTPVSRKSVSRAIARLAIRWKRPRHALANRPASWRQVKGG